MKNLFLISLLALLGMTQAVAQEYEYVPFVREGVKWVYYIRNYHYGDNGTPSGEPTYTYRTLEFKGEAFINGKTYMAMHKYSGSAINEVNDTIPIYMREENRIVYGIIPDGRYYDDCPIGNNMTLINEYDCNEFVLYDFQDPSAFWISQFDAFPETQGTCQYLCTDMINLGNHLAKRCICQRFESTYLYTIEGIGIDAWSSYTLCFFMPYEIGLHAENFSLSHVVENGQIIYKGMYYREGVVTGIDEVVADQRPRHYDGNYYDLTGRCMGTEVPMTPGIYIHNGNKICVSRMP